MFVKVLVIVAFMLRVLVSAEQAPAVQVPALTEAAGCVGMVCLTKCCTSKTCCAGAQQQETPSRLPEAPVPELQVAVIDFQLFALLYALSAEERNFIVADEKSGGHALPPLVMNCIQLI